MFVHHYGSDGPEIRRCTVDRLGQDKQESEYLELLKHGSEENKHGGLTPANRTQTRVINKLPLTYVHHHFKKYSIHKDLTEK